MGTDNRNELILSVNLTRADRMVALRTFHVNINS